MSVASKNPFAILDAEDSSRPSSPAPAQSKDAAAPLPPSAASRGQQKPRGGPAARGGKYYARGGKPSAPKDSQPTDDNAVTEGQRKLEGYGGRGGRGGRGAGRGVRGGRSFDRHSQTGKVDTHKKVHQGWGGDDGNTEFKAEEAASADATAETSVTDWAADTTAPTGDWGTPIADVDAWGTAASAATAADDSATATAVPADGADKPEGGRSRREREPEEEDNTLTLDQYLAQKKEVESAAVPKLENTRKANEGANADIWKDVVPLSKNEEEDAYFIGKAKSAPKPRAKKEEKVFIEIDARFERPDRGGRGRGRGGDRAGDRGGEKRGRGGRGGRGGRQNGNATGTAVNVDDQTAFPSLS